MTEELMKITEEAARQIRAAAEQGAMGALALRIAAERNAEGSIEYRMGFDESSVEDIHIKSGGVHLVIAGDQQELLAGTVLDYVELSPGDFRFIFMNPNDPGYVPPGAPGAPPAPKGDGD